MIDNEVMESWGCGCGSMTITPEEDLTRWAVCKTITVLANADYYYTKEEVNKLIEEITASGVTRAEVEEMISTAIATKADKSEVDALAIEVRENTRKILERPTRTEVNSILANYYSKLENNSMFANYSKVENNTLILNAENITT